MNLNRKVIATGVSLGTLTLAGCANFQETRDFTEKDIEKNREVAKDGLNTISKMEQKKNFSVSDGVFIADKTTQTKYEEKLPEMNITLSSQRSLTLNQIVERVRLETGIPVQLEDYYTDDEEEIDIEIDDLTQLPVMPLAPSESGYVVDHDGSLDSLLDKLSSQFDLSWKYESGRIVFFRYQVKVIDVEALPGSSSTNSSLSGGSGSFGTGGAGTSQTSLSATSSIWESLDANIRAMMSESGKMVVSETTGKVIIKDRPHNVERIEKYVEEENKDFRKQVMVNIKVLSVNKDNQAGADFNWNAVSGTLLSDYSLNLSGGGNMGLGSGAAIIGGSVDGGQSFQGSEAVFEAISRHSDTSLMTNVFVSTLNNQPAPLQVVRKQAYIRSIGTTTTETSTTTNIEQDVIDTGFSISILPKILKDGEILLQYAINLSDLQNIETISSGGQTVQTPEIDTRDFLQRISIKSGETMVLSGFERMSSSRERRIAGANDSAQNDMIVIIMTPVIISR
jgi:type IVB pilus formation R64 PilN family outer membrane protein